ncbi:cytochrome b/b6 domain-containing protein [Neogemmobacter tilapiae]|nr:cytochrome b/b6 domain-containing protein [Gemmobacter tilapiae]
MFHGNRKLSGRAVRIIGITSSEDAMPKGPLVRRHSLATRLTHWGWAISLFFLLLSGLQIFNAFPSLHIGQESGFDYDNAVFSIGAEQVQGEWRGITRVFGQSFDTTGYLGLSGESIPGLKPGEFRAFPAALTVPSYQSLALGRSVHFLFAWGLVISLAAWLIFSALNGHLRHLWPSLSDLRRLPADLWDHLRFRFHHSVKYGPLQKLTYALVLFVALPGMILTGLCLSPGFNAAAPWLLDLFGGRQTARTLHFLIMLGLVVFFIIHIAMILLAGPINELRSIVTGWYRTDAKGEHHE